jgi:hypothetical protein
MQKRPVAVKKWMCGTAATPRMPVLKCQCFVPTG